MTPGYARSVGQIAYAWGWPMVNIQSRRLMYTQVMTLLAQADGRAEAGPEKVGRNAPCPCGSGLKYKKCHGRNRVFRDI